MMNIGRNNLYLTELSKAADSFMFQELKDCSFLITGATGLIGSAIVDLLLWINRYRDLGMRIYATSRNAQKVCARFSEYSQEDGLYPVAYDARKSAQFDFHADYIIHAASNATPDEYVSHPVDTMLCNVLGIHELLQYAIEKNVKRTIYVSSSEVYGVQKCENPLKEYEYGTVDLLNLRSSYPVGKQAAETMCLSYVHQYGCDVSIVRPGHIYGPTATRTDRRVSSAFAFMAAEGKDIVMKSPGTQIRSYCHCLDCATAILTVLLRGKAGEAYNISNPNSIITIRRMAQLLAKAGGVLIRDDFPTSNEEATFNPMNNSSLNSKKLEALGWKNIYRDEDGLRSTVEILRNAMDT